MTLLTSLPAWAQAAPTITGLSSYTGLAGAPITITGTGFDPVQANDRVTFGDVRAQVLSATGTSLVARVPIGASAGLVKVAVGGFVASTSRVFFPVQAKVEALDANALGFAFASPAAGDVALGDIDGDGRVDLVDSSIAVYRNIGQPGSIEAGSFDSPVGVGSPVTGVKLADLDGDGLPEIIATTHNKNFGGSVAIFRNLSVPGSIVFQPVNFTSNRCDRIPLVGDFDGDGRIDILLPGFFDSDIFYRNTTVPGGPVQFDPTASTAAIAHEAVEAAVVDIDGDGAPDIVQRVADLGDRSTGVNIYRNTTQNGVFSVSALTRIQVAGSGAFAVQDLDGDQRPDFLFASSDFGVAPGPLVSVVRNLSTPGQPVFATPSVLNLNDGSTETFGAVMVDLNGDGQPELLVATVKNLAIVPVSPISGGGFSLGAPTLIPQVLPGSALLAADVDGDGRTDVLAANPTGTSFFLNTLAPVPAITSLSQESAPIGTPLTITGRNFDPSLAGNVVRFGAVQAMVTDASPTILKVVVPPSASNAPVTVTVPATGLTATSAARFTPVYPTGRTITSDTFAQPVTFATPGSVNGQAVADLDQDGKPDAVLVDRSAGKLVLLRNVSAGADLNAGSLVPAGELIPAQAPSRVRLADLDGDGRLDLVAVTPGNLVVYPNIRQGGPLSASAFGAPLSFATGSQQLSELLVADFDNDGSLDIAAADGDRSKVLLFRNASSSGNIALAARQEIEAGLAPQGMAMADVDGDGLTDLVIIQNNLVLFHNRSRRGELRFTADGQIDAQGTGFSVQLADLDGDRRPDLLWTVPATAAVHIARNISTLGTVNSTSFAPDFTKTAAQSADTIAVADLDGDGAPEILVTSAGAVKSTAVFRNLFSGGPFTADVFAPRVEFNTGLGQGSIMLQDLDGDGKPDLLAPNGNDATLSVLQNRTFIPSAAFFFTNSVFTGTEGSGSITVTVARNFAAPATIKYSTSDGSAISPGDYTAVAGTATLSFLQGEMSKTINIPITEDNVSELDESFFISLSAAPPGAVILAPATARVVIVDNDAFGATSSVTNIVVPDPVLPFTGTLTVNLSFVPSAALVGQWRLLGEIPWRDSGTTVSQLLPGNYQVEYRPIAGYLAPDPTTVVIVGSVDGTANVPVNETYEASVNAPIGNLSVIIKPDDVAGNAQESLRGQWREQGEMTWRNSGETLSGIPAGPHLIEFKTIADRATPPLQSVVVTGGATTPTVGTYFLPDPATGDPVAPVSDFNVQNLEPYVYMGQIQTDAGAGSGFVVLDRTVLTAAHVIFDDGLLAFTPGVRWYLQRTPGSLQAPPILPRGAYVFTGYAGQRTADQSSGLFAPGASSPASQNLDVAALFFEEPAARNGFGGFLRSDAQENEWLRSARSKTLLGYPVEGGPPVVPGRLHASPPLIGAFDITNAGSRVYKTTLLRGFPGCSGGPLCVLLDNGRYYPAAVFLGGTAQTLVRAIDTQVVDLINRAQDSANGGANNTGGGAVQVSTSVGNAAFSTATIVVNLFPAAVRAQARWSLTTEPGTLRSSGQSKRGLPGGQFTLTFADVPGFNTPPDQNITVTVGGSAPIPFSATYIPQSKPIITSASAVRATLGVNFSYQIVSSNGADSFGATGLPKGLTLSASGTITGKPGVEGTYAVSLRAHNAAGDTFLPLMITVSPPGELQVSVTGGGSVNAGFLGLSKQAQGKSLTVIATPARGFVFSGYTGDLTSSSARFTFVMPERLSLVANFIPSPFTATAGTYYGLLTRPDSAGPIVFTSTATGAFTLSGKLNGKPFSLKKSLALDGSFAGTIGTGATAMPVQMQLDLTGTTGLSGTFTTGGLTYGLQAYQRGFDKRTNPADAYLGRYTIALEPVSTATTVPQGIGSGTAIVVGSPGTELEFAL